MSKNITRVAEDITELEAALEAAVENGDKAEQRRIEIQLRKLDDQMYDDAV